VPPASSTSTGPSKIPEARQLDRPQLLFFYSRTSGSSRRVDGFLAQVLQLRRNHASFRLHKIDIADRPDLVERFRIEKVPTLVVVDDKRVRARLSTPRGCVEIARTLAPWLRR
jgi:thioredoxin-like negative regulator of GroEL